MNQITPQSGAVTKVLKFFPTTKQEDLKIYGIVSAHGSVANFINEDTCKLVVLGAYNLDEALLANQLFLQNELKDAFRYWKPAVLTSSISYVYAVPVGEMGKMIDRIEDYHNPKVPEDKLAKSVQELEAGAQYIFGKAEATAYEKGILTGVLGRFRNNVMTIKENEK